MWGGDPRPAARGRGPEGRSYAVTIMAAVTRLPRPCAPSSGPRPAPRAGELEAARRPARTYRLRGRLRGAQ